MWKEPLRAAVQRVMPQLPELVVAAYLAVCAWLSGLQAVGLIVFAFCALLSNARRSALGPLPTRDASPRRLPAARGSA
jgi:hypothetical protein